jgi:hypothetical protein
MNELYKNGKTYIIDEKDKIQWGPTIRKRISNKKKEFIEDLVDETLTMILIPTGITIIGYKLTKEYIRVHRSNTYEYRQKKQEQYKRDLKEYLTMSVKGIN